MKRCPSNHIDVKGVCVSQRLHNILRTDGVSVNEKYLNDNERIALKKLKRKGIVRMVQPHYLPKAKGWQMYRYRDDWYA